VAVAAVAVAVAVAAAAVGGSSGDIKQAPKAPRSFLTGRVFGLAGFFMVKFSLAGRAANCPNQS